ncbi:MAG: hypothetical protein KC503_09190 [Myxococcales bacterium]|nr:hypothetical protein [Myxococcales bacterium]
MTTTVENKTKPALDDPAHLLAAGALLLPKTKAPEDARVDKVQARTYHHAALGERPVVRLVPEALSRGEDVKMTFLGFGEPKVSSALALSRHRSLGFPGWALINDPDRARYALEVMKDFRREARRARSKPGHAKDGFDAIAAQLSRSVPHFLPSFYEEAGRAFVEEGNATYAAQCFGKARDAEKVHALEIKEDERRQSFIEFALAGAVTIKALQGYAKDLADSYDPQVAYQQFRELAVRRTLGGLPPWSAMAKDMKRLAKAAKLDLAAEEQSMLAELLPAAAITRAPEQFWEGYADALAGLLSGPNAETVRQRVLAISPEPPGYDKFFLPRWIEILDKAGALSPWLEGTSKKKADDKSVTAAGWLARMLDLSLRGWRRRVAPDVLMQLLRRLAPHLEAQGVPLRTWSSRSTELETDFTDLALELGVKVADPPREVTADLDDWASGFGDDDDDDDKTSYDEHPRDPTFVAADERFSRMLARGVSNAAGGDNFEKAATGKSAFLELRRTWINKLVSAQGGALPRLDGVFDQIESQTSVRTFGEFPEALPKLREITVVDRLQRTLAGGFIGEMCWPVMEKAWAKFKKDLAQDAAVSVFGAFPYMVLSDERRALVIGPSGVEYEHDLQLPKGATLRRLQFVPAHAGGRGERGELFVGYRTKDYDEKGYWSSAPKKKTEVKLHGWYGGGIGARQVALEDGGVYLGDGALRVGGTEIPRGDDDSLCDGETFWTYDWDGGERRCKEVDPLTGKKGRYSRPRFLEEFISDGRELDINRCDLYPLPPGVEDSPLGARNGLYGQRARTVKGPDDDGDDDEYEIRDEQLERERRAKAELERIDGLRFVGALGGAEDDDEGSSYPEALLSMPGFDKPTPIVSSGYTDYDDLEWTYQLWDTEGRHVVSLAEGGFHDGRRYDRAAPLTLPQLWWHVLEPRDEAGSRALREIDEATASALLDAALEDVTTHDEDDEAFSKLELPKSVAAVKKLLPKITSAELRLNVAGVAATAARLSRRRDELAAMRDPENPEAQQVAGDDDDTADKISDQLKLLCETGWQTAGMMGQLRAATAFFADGQVRKIPESNVRWYELVGRIGALAFFGPTPALEGGAREALCTMLEAWADSPLCEPGTKLRHVECKLRRSKLGMPLQSDDYTAWGLGEHGGNRYMIADIDCDEDEQSGIPVLEWMSSGKPVLLPDAKITEEGETRESGGGWGTPERLRAVAQLVRERGERPFEREHAEALAERSGLSYPEACLLWAGMPKFDEWNKNFLPKALREAMGLKVAEAEAARSALKQLDRQVRRDILDAGMPDDPQKLYDPLAGGDESFIARFGDAVKEALGDRFTVDAELASLLDKELKFDYRDASEMVPLLTEPKKSKELTRDGEWTLSDWGSVDLTDDDLSEDDFFSGQTLRSLAAWMMVLHAELPAGHKLVAKLDKVYELAQKRLASGKLLLDGPMISTGNHKKALALVESFGGKAFKPKDTSRKKDHYGCDTGDLIVLPDEDDSYVHTAVRPAKVKDWDRVHKLAEGVSDACVAAQLLLSPGLAAIAERAAKPVIDEGAFEANPLASAPDVVTKVRKKIDLSEDAAVYYLQLLALPRPSDKHITRYNGWKPAQIKKAAKELAARGLVVEAKRARAGRAVFLPGGWEDLSRPHLPVESWKLPLYGVRREKDGSLTIPLDYLMSPLPLGELFAAAWKRVSSGDEPRYEEVPSGRGKKKASKK